MGQGVITSLAQMLADELEVSLESVDMVMGDTDRCPHDDGTWGSMSTPYFGPVLRAAAAEARMILRELAAEHLKLPAGRLVARDGVISDQDDAQKRVTYAALAKGKAIARQVSGKPELKAVSAFKVIGKSVLRRDAREKVTGRAQYTLPSIVVRSKNRKGSSCACNPKLPSRPVPRTVKQRLSHFRAEGS